jgi:hypothetical protein
MKRFTTIALAAVALVAAGCGGSSRLSNAAFTSKANAICTAANAASAKISGAAGTASIKPEEKLVTTTIAKLKALSPPTDRTAAFNSYLSYIKHVDSDLHELVSAVASKNSAKLASIETGVTALERKGNKAAKAAGIDSCA